MGADCSDQLTKTDAQKRTHQEKLLLMGNGSHRWACITAVFFFLITGGVKMAPTTKIHQLMYFHVSPFEQVCRSLARALLLDLLEGLIHPSWQWMAHCLLRDIICYFVSNSSCLISYLDRETMSTFTDYDASSADRIGRTSRISSLGNLLSNIWKLYYGSSSWMLGSPIAKFVFNSIIDDSLELITEMHPLVAHRVIPLFGIFWFSSISSTLLLIFYCIQNSLIMYKAL